MIERIGLSIIVGGTCSGMFLVGALIGAAFRGF